MRQDKDIRRKAESHRAFWLPEPGVSTKDRDLLVERTAIATEPWTQLWQSPWACQHRAKSSTRYLYCWVSGIVKDFDFLGA
jgi:hypothetical protein